MPRLNGSALAWTMNCGVGALAKGFRGCKLTLGSSGVPTAGFCARD
ncbi:hypothetical protein [Thiomonas sp. FB-Cd]|nr:hypothetical protein [Thiomonas sp. FB-Cd]